MARETICRMVASSISAKERDWTRYFFDGYPFSASDGGEGEAGRESSGKNHSFAATQRRYCVNCAANPVMLMFSAMASCGISRYFHGLPPFLAECSLACLHHLTAESFFASTSGSSNS